MTTEIDTSESELIQTEPNTPEATAADGEVEEPKQEEQSKTFTQAEVDALVQKRLLKEERRVHRRIEQQMRESQQQQVRQQPPERQSYQDDEAYLRAHIEHLAEQKAAEKLSNPPPAPPPTSSSHTSFSQALPP